MIRLLLALAALLFSAPAFSQTILPGPPTSQGTVVVTDYKRPSDADWTPAFTRALATGKSVVMPDLAGGYVVSDALTIASPGQRLIGFGPGKSYFHLTSSFNMSAAGVVVVTPAASESFAGAQDIGFVFEQPDSLNRASYVNYPWAISMVSVSRPYLGGVIRITGAWNGINATGNTGGLTAGSLQIGAMNVGMQLDGALDFVSIQNLNCWPHGFSTANPIQPYSDGTTVCLKSGRVDGLAINKLSTFRAKINFIAGTDGQPTFGAIDFLSLDGNWARVDGAAGFVSVGAWYKSSGIAGDYAFNLTGGEWRLGQYRQFYNGGSQPGVLVAGASANIASGFTDSGSTSAPAFRITSGQITLEKPVFNYGTNTARTAPFIDVAGGIATVKDPRFQGMGTGSGIGIAVANNAGHVIAAPVMSGWGVSLPSSISAGSYTFDTIFSGTPTAYFQTAGDSALTYTNAATQFTLSGRTVSFRTSLSFNTNAFTTAAGAFVIVPNIAYAPTPAYQVGLAMPDVSNVTFTGYSAAYMSTSGSVLVKYTQSAAAQTNWGTGNIRPSTTGVIVNVSGSYPF